ncbi:MAG: aldolase/citrate lyase family protein [Deltaproteobacteria bacterium]|nr:aldolase/citrate lyase family protein [Deltaproteobacteria bacterium]
MPWGKNKLKEILARGEVALGTCCYTFSPAVVELAGHCGLDFVRIDNEHAWRQDESVENLMRAAHVGGIVPILRIDRENPYLVRKALEVGAGGIIVPHVNTAQEVEEIVAAAKFPPKGDRGYGGLCWSGKWGADAGPEWVKWSDEETMVWVMIEDYRALDNLEAIFSVPGLDAVLFGPADYSFSVGVPTQTSHPKVMDGLKKTLEVATKHGIPVCIGVGFPWAENAKKYIDLGCRLIELGHDVTILQSMWKRTLSEIGQFKKAN